MKAAVVGGGLGGITAAVALRRVGWEVVVLERAPAFGEVGAGVGVMPNALRALAALGLDDEVRRIGTPRVAGGVLDRRGRPLTRVDAGRLEHVVAVHRADLHRVLRSALPAGCLVTDAEVRSVDDLDADLVVAADGIRSGIRRSLFPDHPGPVYAGTTAWRGVSEARFPADLAIGQTLGPGVEAGVLPLGDGRVCWYAATVAPAGGRADDELGEVRRLVGDWHDPIPAVLAATPPEAVLRHDVHELGTPLPTYVRGRVALLGDAAHAMTPYLGQGACMAIEDGVVLASLCARHDVPTALAEYDRARRPRTQAVARASRAMGRVGHRLRNPVAVAVRDAAVRAVPTAVALRGMTRFLRWTAPELSPDGGNMPGDVSHK
ncbi:FAD-dependent monooxygenase [Saccharothrix longispora]|uniref:2-polyprenyl-6-methoxyphenol hydroxylase-like FAD-dependent oxidoreductase n=1 Tax=Saccharothrix longispora TaxID=33920 RepID=A0ABU1Q796_9PSEU|nr:FAD-dependent monooxygenase [Saccharothrix longispora]MDR6598780.1 2-polyprenyl-6-methoxyphenol hydroxylase-like FAD-dependent oxidoreductase [Saccharothrix longispora]